MHLNHPIHPYHLNHPTTWTTPYTHFPVLLSAVLHCWSLLNVLLLVTFVSVQADDDDEDDEDISEDDEDEDDDDLEGDSLSTKSSRIISR